ncbi:penicillin-binding protein 2 [Paraburkholderia sp. CNPSo 3272]|uniref:peptidoglycan D,D-transpeptidase FtsI family protein n=1 Tax=Paraburkholderia sp. CNPSo 3272 TaxID=2940931 RepID=UPI0020B85201|nr:penicillin-binding protein 2 [Paraburkholderia sp. CNPSo 3272]MCP3725183.1 penicillin-binding protein 2 [Paraburkholderia sp. CNPSo 3272]
MALITVAFAACIVRAFWIQVAANGFYRRQGDSRVDHVIDVPAQRGRILDRNGAVLAASVPVKAIWIDATAVPDDLPPGKLATLARLLDLAPQRINAAIDHDRSFFYLKHDVPLSVADQVESLRIPGIHASPEYQRVYPEGEVTAQDVGFTGLSGNGEDGIELAADATLRAEDGQKLVVRDRVGHVVMDLGDITPVRPGTDIRLALNSHIQSATWLALRDAVTQSGAENASAVVVDGKTGEILALANYPSYDPNDRTALRGAALRNRAVTDVFEPGSIMKPFTVSLALDLQRVSPDSLVQTNRSLLLDGATITDDANFGTLTVAGVIQKSSNIGATKISLTMKPEEIWGMYDSLGLGHRPALGFPGAAPGIVRPWRHWRRIEQATMSYGYGLSVSLVQLAQAYTVFVDDGTMMPLSIYKRSGLLPAGTRVFTQRTADEMRAMLESVVAKGGTAPQAQVPGYSVGGKTGTAYTATAHGYDHSAYRASFVGILPIREPRLIIAVSVNKPKGARHFGGDVSGPVFARIAQIAVQVLGLAPDKPVSQVMKDGKRQDT